MAVQTGFQKKQGADTRGGLCCREDLENKRNNNNNKTDYVRLKTSDVQVVW